MVIDFQTLSGSVSPYLNILVYDVCAATEGEAGFVLDWFAAEAARAARGGSRQARGGAGAFGCNP
eukprot:COSAG05_NODE_2735_length_2712_cov_2.337543_7_plen_65_part_00